MMGAIFALAVTLGVVTVPLIGEAQPAGKAHRIGYLSFEPPPTPDAPALGLQRLQEALDGLGYREGQNLVFEYRWAALNRDAVPGLVRELVSAHVDMIVTWSTGNVLRAKSITTTVPIVCALCADLVGGGAVASLARPGGNVTGFTVIGPELTAKRMELLKELGMSRVVALHAAPPDFPVAARWRKENERAGQILGLGVEALHARELEKVASTLASAAKQPGSAVSFMEEPSYLVHRRWIADAAARHRVPTMFPFAEHVAAGGLLSYGVDVPELFARTAVYVEKILKGTKPADLPVEQPTRLHLAINLKTAKALGLAIPPAVLARADELIE